MIIPNPDPTGSGSATLEKRVKRGKKRENKRRRGLKMGTREKK